MIKLEIDFNELLVNASNWIDKKESKVFEIGCKKGDFAKLLFKRGIKNYIGMDTDPNLINEANKRNFNYRFLIGDINENFNYFSKMSTVVMINQLQGWKDDIKVINNIKPGTKLVFITSNYQKKDEHRSYEIKLWAERYVEYVDYEEAILAQDPVNYSKRFFLFIGKRNAYINSNKLVRFPHIKLESAGVKHVF